MLLISYDVVSKAHWVVPGNHISIQILLKQTKKYFCFNFQGLGNHSIKISLNQMKHYLCFNFQGPLSTGKLCTYSNISQTDNYFVVLISRAHQGPGNHIIIKISQSNETLYYSCFNF